jgi:hypothetical protein
MPVRVGPWTRIILPQSFNGSGHSATNGESEGSTPSWGTAGIEQQRLVGLITPCLTANSVQFGALLPRRPKVGRVFHKDDG